MLSKQTRIGLLAPITWPIPPEGYGAWERVVANLAKGLALEGFTNVTLLATKQAHIPGVRTVSIIDRPLSQQTVAGKSALEHLHIAASMHLAGEFDIIHNHLNYFPLLFSDFIQTPVITTMHGSAIEPASKLAYLHYSKLPFASISNFERTLLPELNYVATVYNSVDFDIFTLNKTPQQYLVNAGRVHPSKGVHNAIELALLVGMPLYIAGPVEEDCKEYFATRIAPFIDNKRIFYVGSLPPKELYALVSNALVFVGLIEWDEPFGLAVAEAMACGTPVIGTPNGAHREIIEEGVTGILVQTVQEAADKFAMVAKINREQCHATAKLRFSISSMTKGYIEAYEKVLS